MKRSEASPGVGHAILLPPHPCSHPLPIQTSCDFTSELHLPCCILMDPHLGISKHLMWALRVIQFDDMALLAMLRSELQGICSKT